MTPAANPERVYAIGDIHGQSALLRGLHQRIEADLAARPVASHAVVHIGDYTDRGPDSPGVIDFLLDGEAAGRPWINLLGNHDRMFRLFLETPGGRDLRLRSKFGWLHERLGGRETLAAYGVEWTREPSLDGAELHEAAVAKVPARHRAFLDALRLTWSWRGVCFVHAGVKPGVPLARQVEDDLIWIRDEFHESRADHGALIVHGHTPVDEVEDHGNRIAIDTGAAYGGALSCVAFDAAGEAMGVRVLGRGVLR